MNTTASTIPQEDRPEEPKKVIRLAKRQPDAATTIQSLVSNRWHVLEDANLLDLADDFNSYPGIPAVAVTNTHGRLLGQIIRGDLFDLLGRPFGRDVLQKEAVIRVAHHAKTFRASDSILKVCEEIGQQSLDTDAGFFPIQTAKGEFSGIFSVQDLLVHLAGRTRSDTQHSSSFQKRILKEMQIQETEIQDIMSTTFRVADDGSTFCHLRQYDSAGWHLSLCSPASASLENGLAIALLWGIVNSFDMSKGLMNYIRHLNALLNKTFEPPVGFNGLFMDYQSDTGSLLLCDHGNGSGFIYRKGQVLRMKTAANPSVIGSSAQLSTEISKYQLQGGDRVFIMGAGLAGQTNTQGETYGPNRVKQILEAKPDASVRELRQLIQADLRTFRGAFPQERDAALVILHRK